MSHVRHSWEATFEETRMIGFCIFLFLFPSKPEADFSVMFLIPFLFQWHPDELIPNYFRHCFTNKGLIMACGTVFVICTMYAGIHSQTSKKKSTIKISWSIFCWRARAHNNSSKKCASMNHLVKAPLVSACVFRLYLFIKAKLDGKLECNLFYTIIIQIGTTNPGSR